MTSDQDLACAAQCGDAVALGLLLERHRARLHAHALQLVGYADAHDAVHDTFVVAMRRIGSVRDPGAVAGWLHTVLRNACLDRLRTRVDPVEAPDVAAPAEDEPEAAIDALALRDWVWTSVGRLSDPLRLVTMLRHFSTCSAYDDIAAVCDIPVGTVRSRLNQARRLLADDLLRTAAAAHDEAAGLARAERRRWTDAWADNEPADVIAHMHRGLELRLPKGAVRRGRDTYRAIIDRDLEDGVRLVVEDVVAGPGMTIVEARFVNPREDPFHCPPATAHVYLRTDELVERMLVHHAPRSRSNFPAGSPVPVT